MRQTQGNKQIYYQKNSQIEMMRRQRSTSHRRSSSEDAYKLVEKAFKLPVQKNRILYEYPASLKHAKTHSIASKFGYTRLSGGKQPQFCKCCYSYTDNKEFPLCYPTTIDQNEYQYKKWGKDFELKISIALYFLFLKMLITYLTLHFVICDGFNLYRNYVLGKDCDDSQEGACEHIFFNYASSLNQVSDHLVTQIQNVLNLVTIILSILFFFIYRSILYSINKTIDNAQHTQNQFALLVHNIPVVNFFTLGEIKQIKANIGDNFQISFREHLENFFSDKIKDWLNGLNWNPEGSIENEYITLKNEKNVNLEKIVPSISLCYDLTSLETLQSRREELIKSHREELREVNSVWGEQEDEETDIPQQVFLLNNYEVQLCKKFANDNSLLFILTHFVGNAFVTFQCEHFREYIFEQSQKDPSFLEFSGGRLKVQKASSPSDIYWKNMKVSTQARSKRIVFSYFVLAIVLLFVFTVQAFFTHLQVGMEKRGIEGDESAYLKGKIIRCLMGVIPFFVNFGLRELIVYLTKGEKHTTKSSETLSITIKLIIYQFINIALLYLVVSFMREEYTSQFGLIPQISIIVLFTCFLRVIVDLINPSAMIRNLRISKYDDNVSKDKDTVNKFQIELNEEFQYAEFNLASRYADYLAIFLTVTFYAFLMPILILFAIMFFIAQYWVDKYNLFKRSRVQYDFNFLLTRKIIKIFESSIFFKAVGTLFFTYLIHGEIGFLNWIILFISVLYLGFLLAGKRVYEKWIFGKYEVLDKVTYDDCVTEKGFDETYWKSNPATNLIKECDAKGGLFNSSPIFARTFSKQF